VKTEPVIHDDEYRLGVGDSLKILVYGEPDLSIEARIGEKGLISYPFLGTIKVLGMTSGELERFITEGLRGDYLVNPEVLDGRTDLDRPSGENSPAAS